jgi:hypothetical protein
MKTYVILREFIASCGYINVLLEQITACKQLPSLDLLNQPLFSLKVGLWL